MGTKNNPAFFDCYAKAEPDEPIFTLLGRDASASLLVKIWVEIRRAMGEDMDVMSEAFDCSNAMLAWALKCGKRSKIAEAVHALRSIGGVTTSTLDAAGDRLEQLKAHAKIHNPKPTLGYLAALLNRLILEGESPDTLIEVQSIDGDAHFHGEIDIETVGGDSRDTPGRKIRVLLVCD